MMTKEVAAAKVKRLKKRFFDNKIIDIYRDNEKSVFALADIQLLEMSFVYECECECEWFKEQSLIEDITTSSFTVKTPIINKRTIINIYKFIYDLSEALELRNAKRLKRKLDEHMSKLSPDEEETEEDGFKI